MKHLRTLTFLFLPLASTVTLLAGCSDGPAARMKMAEANRAALSQAYSDLTRLQSDSYTSVIEAERSLREGKDGTASASAQATPQMSGGPATPQKRKLDAAQESLRSAGAEQASATIERTAP